MKEKLIFILFCPLFFTQQVQSGSTLLYYSYHELNLQNPVDGRKKTILYKKGIDALNAGDTLIAENFFSESIREYKDAASFFELGRIYLKKNTYLTRNLAYENFRSAVLIEPDNIEYRYAFADLMKDFARLSSFNEYLKIISIDSTQVDAWQNLGELKAIDFKEYNNSVRDMGGLYGDLGEFTERDFYDSENYFKEALSRDSLHYKTSLQLSLLYEIAGLYPEAISLLERLVRNNKGDKEIHLLLGLLYYRSFKYKESNREFQTAIGLMNTEERDDFTFNSVRLFLESSFREVFESYGKDELKEFVNEYWKKSDPLFMTEYNERLLEHYARVTYADLNFDLPSAGIKGWKSNMGETVVRYGQPMKRLRVRPQIDDTKVKMKTEVWTYNDMAIAFTDMASSGNFKFVWPASEKDKLVPQVPGNYNDFAEYLRKERPSRYLPRFEGPEIDASYSILQFKSSKRNHTDLYLHCFLSDSLSNSSGKQILNTGFYFLNRDYDEKFSRRDRITIDSKDGDKIATNLNFTVLPDSGFTAFEIIREIDKGTFSSRNPFRIKKFSNEKIDISDLCFAEEVSDVNSKGISFHRNKIIISPIPRNIISKGRPVHIYYEIYNLVKDGIGLTDFEQNITISDYGREEGSGFARFVSSVLNFLGITSDGRITLSSKYRTIENDAQIYFQLDFGNYSPGEYLIEISVTDNISGLQTRTANKLTIVDQ
ncbi:MAG TPA: GWxTD domain-containing protein [Melioribacteraceae bacterium]|nr:GWxTD domain-containing protein [Melioribacteraceae bacterium]